FYTPLLPVNKKLLTQPNALLRVLVCANNNIAFTMISKECLQQRDRWKNLLTMSYKP
uniref:Transposase n=1 Tax=Steinernema glaseri TaxID=37863 RepID=A0A1I7Z167_9BILA